MLIFIKKKSIDARINTGRFAFKLIGKSRATKQRNTNRTTKERNMKKMLVLWVTALVAVAALRAQPLVQLFLGQVELVSGVAGPNGPLEMWFPNVFDPYHPKDVRFIGSAEWLGIGTAQPQPLHVTFDYLDLNGQTVYLPGWTLPGDFGISIVVADLLPFCPQQVSIHFDTADPFGYAIVGEFTHVCVPEPAQVGLLAGLGLLGTGVYRRLRRREPTA